jgi:hypothetical protein
MYASSTGLSQHIITPPCPIFSEAFHFLLFVFIR